MLDEATKRKHKRAWNDKYDSKTYEQVTFKLRIKDDAEIIASIKDAQQKGYKRREWLRYIFYRD